MTSKQNTHQAQTGKSAAQANAPTADLLDMNQAIAALKTTRPTFYRWLRSGKLKGIRAGRQWRFRRLDIDRFLRGEGPTVEVNADMSPLIEQVRQKAKAFNLELPMPENQGVGAAVDQLLALAVGMGASDLHISPFTKDNEMRCTVGCRVDGAIQTVAEVEGHLHRPLLERWKLMANLDLLERHKVQDNRIEVQINGHTYDLRLNTLPAYMGEALTVRFLSPDTIKLELEALGYAAQDLKNIKEALARSWGMVLFTGPAGSAKTTALYASLLRLVTPRSKIISIENPIEFALPGIVQVLVQPQHDMTFVALLRGALRADPDVVSLSEIRDFDTLVLAQETALLGHLVLSTLNANEAVSALKRMIAIGADPLLTGESVKLIVSQRLVRKPCPQCVQERKLSSARASELVALADGCGLKADELPKQELTIGGCAHCNQTGYRGRVVIAETLMVTPEFLAAVRKGANAGELRTLAVCQGMTTFVGDGLRKAAAGQTTIEEVLRHLPEK